MSNNYFATHTLTLSPGETEILPGGDFFRIEESGSPVTVRFETETNGKIAEGDFDSGDWLRLSFGLVKITNTAAIAITTKVRISSGESGSDRLAGSVAVSAEEAFPVAIVDGVDSNRITHSMASGSLAANRGWGIYVPPSVDANLALDRFELVTSGEICVSMVSRAASVPTAPGGTWVDADMLPMLAGGAAAHTVKEAVNLTSANSDAAIGFAPIFPNRGKLQAGHHSLDILNSAYIPAGHGNGFVVVAFNDSGSSVDLCMSLSGLKV